MCSAQQNCSTSSSLFWTVRVQPSRDGEGTRICNCDPSLEQAESALSSVRHLLAVLLKC